MRTSVAVVLALLGCGGSKDDGNKTTAAGSGSAAVAPPARVAPGDAAYLVLDKTGLVAIENGALRVVADKFAGRRIQPRKAGGLWLSVDSSIAHYDGELHPVADAPPKHEVSGVAPDGTLWATGDGIASYDGTAWKTYTLPGIRPFFTSMAFAADGTVYGVGGLSLVAISKSGEISEIELPGQAAGKHGLPKRKAESVASGGDGTVYVALNDELAKLSGGKLITLASGKGNGGRLVAAPDGSVWAFSLNGTRKITGDKVEVIAKMPFTTSQVFAPDGTLYGSANEKRIVRRKPDGTVERYPSKDLPFAVAIAIKPIVLDARGRVWLLLDQGMAILDGDKVTLITPGTVPELPRKVEAIYVTGKGPDLPDVGAAQLINLKGVLVDGGKPKAGVKVELCVASVGTFYGDSPCAMEEFVRRATTAADGSFTLSDVPLSGWHILYKKTRDEWIYYFPDGCCGGLAKGATFDMGEVPFGKSSR